MKNAAVNATTAIADGVSSLLGGSKVKRLEAENENLRQDIANRPDRTQKEEVGVLYNDGKIRFDEIADIEVGSVFVGILLRNGYLFYLSRTEPLKTCIYTHGGWGSISEISPRGIAGHIGRELHGKLGDHTAVD